MQLKNRNLCTVFNQIRPIPYTNKNFNILSTPISMNYPFPYNIQARPIIIPLLILVWLLWPDKQEPKEYYIIHAGTKPPFGGRGRR